MVTRPLLHRYCWSLIKCLLNTKLKLSLTLILTYRYSHWCVQWVLARRTYLIGYITDDVSSIVTSGDKSPNQAIKWEIKMVVLRAWELKIMQQLWYTKETVIYGYIISYRIISCHARTQSRDGVSMATRTKGHTHYISHLIASPSHHTTDSYTTWADSIH